MIFGRIRTFIPLRAAFLLFFAGIVNSQDAVPPADRQTGRFPRPGGKRCAVSFTFDDARLSQIDFGIPLLDRFGVKATFYVSPDAMRERLDGWKHAVANGHEIGNHTMHHPCTGNYAFARGKALEDYTLDQMAVEMDSERDLLFSLLGVHTRSFAYPCGETFVGRGKEVKSTVPLVAGRFETGRLWLNEDSNDPGFCDLAQLLAIESDGKSFDQLLPFILEAKEQGRWLIFAGHETAESGPQTTLLKTVDDLCRYAQDPLNGVWMEPVGNIGGAVKTIRNGIRIDR
jgi:peptidoglycan/xylan/chitin deacetylase (PgdA/CDA1 family)